MKILMVHDCAYVGYELKKELIRQGFEVDHLFISEKGFSPLSIIRFAYKIGCSDCDLVHTQFCRSPLYASYLSGKPFIAHCHGTDLRKNFSFVKQYCLKQALKIVVSTEDLLKIVENAVCLPTPVGPQFYNMKKQKKGAIYIMKKYDTRFKTFEDRVRTHIKFENEKWYNGLKIVEGKPFPYGMMPFILNSYEFFIDQEVYPALSATALQALACGCKVLNWQNKIIKELPEKHKVENVTKQLIEIYEEILK